MIDFKSAVAKAGVDAARSLTMDLYDSAIEHGWHPDIARHLSINFDGQHLRVNYPDHVKSHIENLEYGTETQRPTAVIRKFKNRSADIDRVTEQALSKHMGGKL
jgi:hypothetical protein